MSAAATTGADRPNVHKRMPAGAAVAQALAYLGRVGAMQFYATRGEAQSIRQEGLHWLTANGFEEWRMQVYRTHPNIGKTYTRTEWEARVVRRDP